MPKRSTKFYRKNEAEVMQSLGLVPTKNSGAGWKEKEDGQNDMVIAQLKSTDANSIRVDLFDIHKLIYNGNVAHKLPIFVIQFLKSKEVFVLIKPEDISTVSQYINSGEVTALPEINLDIQEDEIINKKEKIKSGNREGFWQEREKEWQKCKRKSNSKR